VVGLIADCHRLGTIADVDAIRAMLLANTALTL
jgi:hypothetical protein